MSHAHYFLGKSEPDGRTDLRDILFLAQDCEKQGRGEGQDELQQLDNEQWRGRLPSPLFGPRTAAAGAPSAAVRPPSAGRRRAVPGVAVLGGFRGPPAAEAAELLHQRDPRAATGRRERQHQQEEARRWR